MNIDILSHISLIIGTGAFFFALMNAFIIKKYIAHITEILGKISYKLNLIEITLAYHDMIDIPYEIDNFEELMKEAEQHQLERDGNVIYLNKDKED
jgi:hypothetical protein